MYHEVHVPKSLTSKIFEPFLKSCTSEVRVPRGRVPRGLTASLKMAFLIFLKSLWVHLHDVHGLGSDILFMFELIKILLQIQISRVELEF